MATVFEVSRRFSVGELVTLYTLDLTLLGGSIYYFTNNVFEERLPIKFGGNYYQPMPISMEDVTVDSQSAPAQPRLSIATAGGPVAGLMANFRDLRGAKVTRVKVYAEFLDLMPDGAGGVMVNPNADPAARIGEELYVIDRKNSADNTYTELQLVSPIDQDGIQLPLRIVRKRWCGSLYRDYDAESGDFIYYAPVDNGCPYAGDDYFDTNDQPTTKANDRCSKRMTGCKARFGNTNALPMDFFPGVKATQEAG